MAATRKDVARRAGVSPAVVSYVLNNGPRPVAPATRKRVLEAIAELQYQPDRLARALRMGTSNALGLLLPDATNPFFAELAQEIETAAFARGYAVLVGNSADDPVRERRYLRDLAERRVDGLIFISSTDDHDLSDLFALNIPVVAMDRSPDDSPLSTIRVDHERGAHVGTQHLVGHGYRHIAWLGGRPSRVSSAREKGWRRALEEAGLRPERQEAAPFSFTGGYDAGHRLLRHGTRPSAVLVATDVQALGLLSACHTLDIAIPDDLAVVSFDGTVAGAHAVPPLTSVRQPIGEMARRAVDHVRNAGGDIVHMSFAGQLVRRRSCGCLQHRRPRPSELGRHPRGAGADVVNGAADPASS